VPHSDNLMNSEFFQDQPLPPPSALTAGSPRFPRQVALLQAKREPMPTQSLDSNWGDDVMIEKESEDIACGLCNEYDPPIVDPEAQGGSHYTTEWVGCDCERWFHKQCTKLTRFTTKFSCRSVKMKCQKSGSTTRSASSGSGPGPSPKPRDLH
jgi:hypothetical protein